MAGEQDHRISYFCIESVLKKNLVIVPTFNESENIEELILSVMGLDRPFDMLVVDDNSPDGTAGLVEALQPKFQGRLHLLKRPNKEGLGPAYMEAFQWALDRDYDFIFEMDATFHMIPTICSNCKKHYKTMMQMLWWVLVMYAGFRLSTGLYLVFYCPISLLCMFV